jgi:outer membrane protein assembly factor BamB
MKKKTITLSFILTCLVLMVFICLSNNSVPNAGKGTLVEMIAPTLAWSQILAKERIGSALVEDGFAYFTIWADENSTTVGVKAYNLQSQLISWTTSETTDNYLLSGNGKLFLLDQGMGILSAISKEDGATAWHTPLPTQGYEYEMTFGSDLLFLGARGVIYAIDTTDGRIVWQHTLPLGFGVNSAWLGNSNVYRDYDALSYYDGLLYIRLWKVAIDSQTIECLLLAVNAIDGQEMWHFAFDIPAPKESHPQMIASQPAFEEELLFFSDWMGRIYLMDKNTGEIIWQSITEFPVVRPLLRDKHVYFPSRDSLLCLDFEMGERVWVTPLSGLRIVSPIRAVEDKVMFIVDHWREEQTELILIDSKNGELTGKLDIPLEDCRGCVTAFEVESDRVYITQQRTIVAIDLPGH